jgi:hypothetical protein
MFCGGLDIQASDSNQTTTWFRQKKASTSCVSIEPDINPNWVEEDPLPEGRVMGNFIYLPDGKLFLTNGVSSGAAGYDTKWVILILVKVMMNGFEHFGHTSDIPYAIDAIMTPNLYDPRQPKGQRWLTGNFGTLNFERLYHSSATLIPSKSWIARKHKQYWYILFPDGCVYIAGSNPYVDVVVQGNTSAVR